MPHDPASTPHSKLYSEILPRSVSNESVMPLGDHLDELRLRLIYALVGLVPILILAIIFGKKLLGWLLIPAQTQLTNAGLSPYLQATSPLETFWAYFKISLVTAIVVGAPWLLYQLWKFVSPGLHRSEQRFVYLLAPLSTVLTAASVVFLYYVMLPVVLAFFIGFGTSVVDANIPIVSTPEGVVLPSIPMLAGDLADPAPGSMWINTHNNQLRVAQPDGIVKGIGLSSAAGVLQQYRISEYLNMVLMMAMGFAIGFQTPVVVLLLGWTGIAKASWLKKYRKHIGFVCAILGAVLTPADPISMLLLAIPLYILFEFGLVLLWLFPAKRVAGGALSNESSGYDEDDQREPGL